MTASRPDAPPAGGDGRTHQVSAPRTSLVLAAAAAGLLLGGLCGSMIAGLQPEVAQSEAIIQVRPDPAVLDQGQGSSSDATGTFVQTQVIRLNSPGFTTLVQARLPGSEPELTATRVEESSTISLRSEAPNADDAVAVASAAAETYREVRTQEVTARLDAEIAFVTEQQAEAQLALQALPAPPRSTTIVESTSVTTARQIASSRASDLVSTGDALNRAKQSAVEVVTVVQEAYPVEAGGLDPEVTGAVGGATLGALLTIGTVVVARRFSRRIDGPEDLSRYGVPFIGPEVPHRRVRRGAPTPSAVAAVVATHAPRLASARDQRPGLVLVGPTSGVGSSYLALQHALHAARRGPALLVRTSGPDDDLLADVLGIDPHRSGLREVPAGRIGPEQLAPMLQETTVPDLQVLTHPGDDDTDLGAFERALESGLLEAAVSSGRHVVLDAPALDRSTAGLVAARRAGSTALVIASGSTRREEVERALDTFAAWGVAPTGIITNRAPRHAGRTSRRPSPGRSTPPRRDAPEALDRATTATRT